MGRKRIRIYPEEDDLIRIVSDNARLKPDGSREFPDEEVREHELHIIGRVFWHAKEL